jgi:tRNA G10  N-methylase Trm11
MLVVNLLTSVQPLLCERQRICIASPKTLQIGKIGETLGYKHMESHFAYVHRTLTREIAVFQKITKMKKEQNKKKEKKKKNKQKVET